MFVHVGIEDREIGDHAGGRIDGAGDGNFDNVIVAVAVGIIALAVDAAILRLIELVAVQAMGGGKKIAAAQRKLQRLSPGSSAVQSTNRSGVSYRRTRSSLPRRI